MNKAEDVKEVIKELKKVKKKWLNKSYSSADIKRWAIFEQSEIKKIKSTIRYGKKRYSRSDILEFYLRKNK